MAGPYSNPYGSLADVNVRMPSSGEQRRGRRASQNANWMRFLSEAAPTAGTLVGGALGAGIGSLAGGVGAIPGAGLGATLGGAAGQLLGAGGNALADEQTRPYEEADLRRRRQLEIASRFLGGA